MKNIFSFAVLVLLISACTATTKPHQSQGTGHTGMAASLLPIDVPVANRSSVADAALPLQSQSVSFSNNASAYTLQVLHAADQEASPDIIENAQNFSAIVNALRPSYANTVVLGSGDLIIPGAFYFATGGKADIEIANAIGFQAVALGNHEFDLGTNALANLIEADDDYAGTTFPYLSSNLDFSNSNLAEFTVDSISAPQANSIAPSVILNVGGELIGVIGLTTPLLPNISSPGDVVVTPANPNDLDQLALSTQLQINTLTQAGINKIIILSHLQQISNDIALVSKLHNVDIIVSGGSDTLLANSDDFIRSEYGKERSGVYPLLLNDAAGQPVALINTDREYRYVGRLVADFDARGILTSIHDDSGAYAANAEMVTALGNPAPTPAVSAKVEEVRDILVAKDGQLFGSTNVFLNGAREAVRKQETNFGNLSADANLAAAQKHFPNISISLKNGGGIRASIGDVLPGDAGTRVGPQENPLIPNDQDGDISQLDIENSLRFNNELVTMDVSASQLKDLLEHGVARWDGQVTAGAFPQIAGAAFSFDPSQPGISFDSDTGAKTQDGQRIRSLVVYKPEGVTDVVVQNGAIVGNPNRTFGLVTLSFLAKIRDNGLGGDSYPFPDNARRPVPNRADAALCKSDSEAFCEQQALADYLVATHPRSAPFAQEDTDYAGDTRIQNLQFRSDTVISE